MTFLMASLAFGLVLAYALASVMRARASHRKMVDSIRKYILAHEAAIDANCTPEQPGH